jgi:hypothetical protein
MNRLNSEGGAVLNGTGRRTKAAHKPARWRGRRAMRYARGLAVGVGSVGVGVLKPYKELMHLLLASSLHVLICGRQGIDYGEDEASGELKSLGYLIVSRILERHTSIIMLCGRHHR